MSYVSVILVIILARAILGYMERPVGRVAPAGASGEVAG